MPRRIAAEALFANLLALFLLALVTAGCGIEQSQSERPNWSLNGPDQPATTPKPDKHYGDWNGAGAPKPLTYDSAQ